MMIGKINGMTGNRGEDCLIFIVNGRRGQLTCYCFEIFCIQILLGGVTIDSRIVFNGTNLVFSRILGRVDISYE